MLKNGTFPGLLSWFNGRVQNLKFLDFFVSTVPQETSIYGSLVLWSPFCMPFSLPDSRDLDTSKLVYMMEAISVGNWAFPCWKLSGFLHVSLIRIGLCLAPPRGRHSCEQTSARLLHVSLSRCDRQPKCSRTWPEHSLHCHYFLDGTIHPVALETLNSCPCCLPWQRLLAQIVIRNLWEANSS